VIVKVLARKPKWVTHSEEQTQTPDEVWEWEEHRAVANPGLQDHPVGALIVWTREGAVIYATGEWRRCMSVSQAD